MCLMAVSPVQGVAGPLQQARALEFQSLLHLAIQPLYKLSQVTPLQIA